MKRIKLTKGQFALVDDADFPWLDRHVWTAIEVKPGKFYAARQVRGEDGKQHGQLMHRYILNLHERPFSEEVDHRDNDGLNNQRFNLRPATRAQNRQNTGPSKGRRFKGVYPRTWLSRGEKKSGFAAYISESGKSKYIALCETEEEAARAYDAKARVLHGEFAKLNFPDPPS